MTKKKEENLFLNILINVVVPSVIMTQLSSPERLGAMNAVLVAVAFPLSYGAWDFFSRRHFSWIALLGLINVVLTGGLTLFGSTKFWFVAKETGLPLMIGLLVVASTWTSNPFLSRLLLKSGVIDSEKIQHSLDVSGLKRDFEKLLGRSNLFFGASFLLSAALNFVLAMAVLQSPTGSTEFTQELGRMTALSFPVISLPVTVASILAFWYFLSGLKRLTGLGLQELLVQKQ